MAQRDGPAWFYSPDGEARIFEPEEAIPAGWEDSPAKAVKRDPFDHDGDGKPGGSKPRRKRA